MVQFEKQDEIPPKLRLAEGPEQEQHRFLTAAVELNVSAQWFRVIRILQAFAIVDDDLGRCASRMLEVMDRE